MKEKVKCAACGKQFKMEIRRCCDGYMCACQGLPVDPIVCDHVCYQIAYGYKINGRTTADIWLRFYLRKISTQIAKATSYIRKR